VPPRAGNGSSRPAGAANAPIQAFIGRHIRAGDGCSLDHGSCAPPAAAPLLLQVHDELVLEAAPPRHRVWPTVKVFDGERSFARVPLVVDHRLGKRTGMETSD